MTPRCAICHALLPDPTDLYACEACGYRLRTMLRELASQMPLLQELLRPGSALPGRGGSGRAHSPMPVRLDVLDLLGPGHIVALEDTHGDQSDGVPITPLLAGWARYIANTHPSVTRDRHGTVRVQPCDTAVPRHGGSVAAWCHWLIAYVPHVVRQEWASDMYGQVEALLRRIQAKTGDRPGRTVRDAPCPGCACFALVSIEGEPLIACEVCNRRLTPEEYREHSAAVLPSLTALAVRIAAQRAAA